MKSLRGVGVLGKVRNDGLLERDGDGKRMKKWKH